MDPEILKKILGYLQRFHKLPASRIDPNVYTEPPNVLQPSDYPSISKHLLDPDQFDLAGSDSLSKRMGVGAEGNDYGKPIGQEGTQITSKNPWTIPEPSENTPAFRVFGLPSSSGEGGGVGVAEPPTEDQSIQKLFPGFKTVPGSERTLDPTLSDKFTSYLGIPRGDELSSFLNGFEGPWKTKWDFMKNFVQQDPPSSSEKGVPPEEYNPNWLAKKSPAIELSNREYPKRAAIRQIFPSTKFEGEMGNVQSVPEYDRTSPGRNLWGIAENVPHYAQGKAGTMNADFVLPLLMGITPPRSLEELGRVTVPTPQGIYGMFKNIGEEAALPQQEKEYRANNMLNDYLQRISSPFGKEESNWGPRAQEIIQDKLRA